MSDTTKPRRRILLNVAVGMGGSIVAGVMVMALWSLQSIVRMRDVYTPSIPLVMGLAGSFWWWRQRGGGWPLWGIVIAETLAIFLVLAAVLVPQMSHSEWSMPIVAVYIMVSPLIALSLYIGARLGYWLLDRRAPRLMRGHQEPESGVG